MIRAMPRAVRRPMIATAIVVVALWSSAGFAYSVGQPKEAAASAPLVAPIVGLWYTNGDTLSALLDIAPTFAGELFDRSASYEWIGYFPDGWATTSYVNYGSYARFVSDLRDGSVPPVHVLMYDPEIWDRDRQPDLQAGAADPLRVQTPVIEQQHPTKYMRLFGRLAHRKGYEVIEAPGLNLMNTIGGDCIHKQGESDVAAYLRCNMAGAAAAHSDAIDVQFQSIQCQTSTYAADVKKAWDQARAANPQADVLSGMSSGWCDPTGDQLFAAYTAVAKFTNGHFFSMSPTNTQGSVDFFARLMPVIVDDPGFSPADQIQMQGVTTSWRVSWNAKDDHSVSDRSGLGLFDSGLHKAGYVFQHLFAGAGTYTATDVATGHTATISVPVTASPTIGSTTQTFAIQASTAGAPAGYAYETQVLRPGAGDWVGWREGATNTFVPDAGTGTYSFRAQLVRTSNGAASGWSPIASITVS